MSSLFCSTGFQPVPNGVRHGLKTRATKVKFAFWFAISLLLLREVRAAEVPGVKVDWLDGAAPASATGVSFGVPWPRGSVQKQTALRMVDAAGQPIASQAWPLAYWPDGSLKWTGHAISAAAGQAGPYSVAPGEPFASDKPIKADQTSDSITIDTGALICKFDKTGTQLFSSLHIGDKLISSGGKLVCILEDRSEYNNKRTTREEDFTGKIESVALESTGPVRAVVKITGKHKQTDGQREWLPFTVRLYFYAGLDSIRIVHSFVFDGDEEKDFIKGLGIRFSVPMRQEFHNRHVRFTGETGIFADPLQVIVGRRNPGQELYDKQVAGQQLPKLEAMPRRAEIAEMAVWESYKLTQITPDAYTLEKRTNPKSAWIRAIGGTRAIGTAFIGDTTGGLSVGMTNFWNLAPTGLEIANASTDTADITLWLWSPDSPAMDMRHYDIKGHGLEASYEDYQPGFSDATGVARTSEITIRAFNNVPTNDALLAHSKATSQIPRLVPTPDYLHSIPVFGKWSLPDRSHPTKAWIEDQLDKAIAFYQGQIEQHRWYGFWDFGDVMHSYDRTRHVWRYDVGGFAWANTELMPDLWLWYSFLRTGRGDVFRMAEAMTRHTQEVDVYHIGRFKGLGSRHNIRHWGDGAKELRIAQALLKRPYYYLTTDERTGDLMDEVVDADHTLVEVGPLRMIEEKSKYPVNVRVGPDWLGMCANWMAAWERTGDTKYRDKIIIGAKCMAEMPGKWFSSFSYGYDPATNKLVRLHEKTDVPHLAALMGGPEMCMELAPLLDSPEFTAGWEHYCRYLQAPREEQREGFGGVVTSGQGAHFSKMTAYAAWKLKDASLADRAWQQFLGRRRGDPFGSTQLTGADVPHPIDENPNASTNNTAQWCLNAIQLLELVGKEMPKISPRE